LDSVRGLFAGPGNSVGANRAATTRWPRFRALELGINWIDTAAIYGLGHSEQVVARALRNWPGKRAYVFTKCGMVWNEKGEVGYSLRSKSIRRECEASLRRLNLDVIDLYQIHWPADDLAETLEGWATMTELQNEGKVRWIGVSNFSVHELQKAGEIASVTSVRAPYSLIVGRSRRIFSLFANVKILE
jgi:aryl-alcohol dehydrogenase-like predicted oxidoreductase